MRGGFVGFSLRAVAFAESEHRRGRELPVLVKLLGERRVILDGRVEIAIGLLLEQALLQERGEFVRLRRRERRGQKKNADAQFCFHDLNDFSLPDFVRPIVTLLQNRKRRRAAARVFTRKPGNQDLAEARIPFPGFLVHNSSL